MTADPMRNGVERKRRGKHGETEAAPPFEAQLEELDTIVTALEDGRLPLEEALTLYERGMRLAKACQDRLDEAEVRVRRLRAIAPTDDADGADGADETTFTLDDLDTDE